MKRPVSFLIFMIAAVSAYCQWYQQESIPSGNDLTVIVFSDPAHGWIASINGEILRTVDGGNSWELLVTGTTLTFTGIHFPDAMNGWAVGYNPNNDCRIIHTVDGGVTWTEQFTGEYSPGNVFFLDSLNGWVAAQDNTLLHTSDGGASWSGIPLPGLAKPTSVQFLNQDLGFVCGTDYDGYLNMVVFKTTDGGVTWEEKFRWGNEYMFSDLYFTDDMNGWITGNYMVYGIGGQEIQGKIICYTNNGGESWGSGYDTEGLAGIAICFNDSENGWGVSREGLFLSSTNGGASWTEVYYPPFGNFSDITFSDSMTGWAVGQGGIVMRTDNNGAIGIMDNPGKNMNSPFICPNPATDHIMVNFCLEQPGEVIMELISSQGYLLETRSLGKLPGGWQSVEYDIEGFTPGIYFCVLRDKDVVQKATAMFIKK